MGCEFSNALSPFLWNSITLTQSVGEQGQIIFPIFFFFPFVSFRPVKTAFENFGFPLVVKKSMVLLLCVYRVQSISCLESGERFLGRSAHGWIVVSGMECGRKMGQFGWKFSASMVWKFTPDHLQDPDKATEYFQGECCGSSRGE